LSADSTGFALKSPHLGVVFSELGRQDLDGNLACELYIAGEIHFTHAARAEQRLNFIMADPVSNERAASSGFLRCFFGRILYD
jgi:hypothetical protein